MTGQYTGYDCQIVNPPEPEKWLDAFNEACFAVDEFDPDVNDPEEAYIEIAKLSDVLDSVLSELKRYS